MVSVINLVPRMHVKPWICKVSIKICTTTGITTGTETGSQGKLDGKKHKINVAVTIVFFYIIFVQRDVLTFLTGAYICGIIR